MKSCFKIFSIAFVFFLYSTAHATEQQIRPEPDAITADSGEEVSFDVFYRTSDNNTRLAGLGLRMHWNSQVLEFQGISNVFTANQFVQGIPESHSKSFGRGEYSDTAINLSWLDKDAQWPSDGLPIRLFRATFKALSDDATRVNFSASSTAEAYGLAWDPVQLGPPLLDVAVVAVPEHGGVVNGGGGYAHGRTARVTAMAQEPYTYIHWREGETVVSVDRAYSFTVTEPRSLEAHFIEVPEGHCVVSLASSNPHEGGTVAELDAYHKCDSPVVVSITASANPGWAFVGWFENGVLVSRNAKDTMEVDNHRYLTAVFEQVEPIPTMSEWGLIALAGLLLLVGALVIRRSEVIQTGEKLEH